jgi:hypothetical protein
LWPSRRRRAAPCRIRRSPLRSPPKHRSPEALTSRLPCPAFGAARERSPGELPGQVRRFASSQKTVRVANAAGCSRRLGQIRGFAMSRHDCGGWSSRARSVASATPLASATTPPRSRPRARAPAPPREARAPAAAAGSLSSPSGRSGAPGPRASARTGSRARAETSPPRSHCDYAPLTTACLRRIVPNVPHNARCDPPSLTPQRSSHEDCDCRVLRSQVRQ